MQHLNGQKIMMMDLVTEATKIWNGMNNEDKIAYRVQEEVEHLRYEIMDC